MTTSIEQYISKVMQSFATGQAREHAHRPAFHDLISGFDPTLTVLNDPARSEHGNPDFVFLRGDLTAGYAETKDVGTDLDKTEKSDQLKRYFGYSNLILTDYLEFRFYRNGERYGEAIAIGILSGGVVVPKSENYELLERTIKDFVCSKPEKIRGGERLAKIMGGKARRIRENVSRYLLEESEKSGELRNVYEVMKKLLVHDLSPEAFADMYAQTLVYGLFVARYHDDTPDTFTRQEARDLVPASNPLLRHFFDHIAGANFDKRLGYIVDELCEVFAVADVQKIMAQYYSKMTLWGETKESPDPVIHFYEDFLKEYDSEQRVKLGAFYTPLPVVRFIVRSIDMILKRDFGLVDGLADTSRIETQVTTQGKKRKESIHRVQILDPAVGTGTFLNETIRFIHKSFEGQGGRWASYVDDDLLPRLHGFELMMAPYTIAHLKLGMTLRDMGYEKFSRRLGVYLTNSLEKGMSLDGTLFESLGFMHSITEEAREASKIKHEKPIMVVLGNPPYSGESSNAFYTNHDVYKVEPGGKEKLKERNSKWLNDDYVKFIRFAESMIEKNGEGLVGMITSHGYIDNPTFRGMRWHLRKTFDTLYVLDLHGNSNKKEVALDGSKDENIFDIKTGVAIIFGVKKRSVGKAKKVLATIYRADIYGTRKAKYEALAKGSIENLQWSNLLDDADIWKVEGEGKEEYFEGFSIVEVFLKSSIGMQSHRDNMVIDFDKNNLIKKFEKVFSQENYSDIIAKYQVVESKTLNLEQAIKKELFSVEKIREVQYRPFDVRYIYYSDAFVDRTRKKLAGIITIQNPAIIFSKSVKVNWNHIYITSNIPNAISVDINGSYFCPLYFYHEDGTKIANLNPEIVEKIEASVSGEVTPEDILDYIYAVLHSPKYRETYKEFLKIDFPRVPYPRNNESFRALISYGCELRGLHLMESPKLRDFITTFPESGSNIVEKVKYVDGKVFINETQYFGNVSEIAWSFYIGGYQPAQKWLKDRKGCTLSNQDLEYYQKIIVALTETERIMKKIDETPFFLGEKK